MQGVQGVEKQSHQADGGEGGRDFARHDAALADPSDHQLGSLIPAALEQGEGRFHLTAAEAFGGRSDSGGFLLQAAGQSGQVPDPG